MSKSDITPSSLGNRRLRPVDPDAYVDAALAEVQAGVSDQDPGYAENNGRCANGHPVNGAGRCQPLNDGGACSAR